MHDRIESRMQRIDAYYAAADADVREKADEIIPWEDYYRLNDDSQFLRFVRNYVEDEHEKRENGRRADPLCRCSDRGCPSKEGRLHPQCIPRRGGLTEMKTGAQQRVENFVTGPHPDVVVAEAQDEWISSHAQILPKLTRASGLLEDHVEGDDGTEVLDV